MTEPHLKALPDTDKGHLHFVMDEAGYDLFKRLLSRAEPRRGDTPANFNRVKDRVDGAFYAGAVQMGWKR